MFVMVVLMSTEGRTDGRLVLDAHQHECSMRSKRSAHVYDSSAPLTAARVCVADAHEQADGTSLACCWCEQA